MDVISRDSYVAKSSQLPFQRRRLDVSPFYKNVRKSQKMPDLKLTKFKTQMNKEKSQAKSRLNKFKKSPFFKVHQVSPRQQAHKSECFQGYSILFAYRQRNTMLMSGDFGLQLQNSTKLLHTNTLDFTLITNEQI